MRLHGERYTRVMLTVHVDDFVQEVEEATAAEVTLDIRDVASSWQDRLVENSKF